MNHYTSYEVSKQLWEAGIKIDSPHGFSAYVNEKGNYLDDCYSADDYPAYTLGELIRELQKYGDREISIDLNPGREVWIHADDYCMPLWKSDDPIEDTVGMALLALIEIRKGESKC